jgi:hypothetical protein
MEVEVSRVLRGSFRRKDGGGRVFLWVREGAFMVRSGLGLDKVACYFVKSTAVVLLKYRATFCKVPRYFILFVG